MRHFLIFSIGLFTSHICFAQDSREREIIEYVNFVRTAPQEFLEKIASPYIEQEQLTNNRYAKSLIRQLQTQKTLPPLFASDNLMQMAGNYAVEAGKKGWTHHVKTNQRFAQYAPEFETTGENLQFGSETALAIVMELLIDLNVSDLGHRKNILDNDYTHIGVGFSAHRTFQFIGVMTFGGGQNE